MTIVRLVSELDNMFSGKLVTCWRRGDVGDGRDSNDEASEFNRGL